MCRFMTPRNLSEKSRFFRHNYQTCRRCYNSRNNTIIDVMAQLFCRVQVHGPTALKWAESSLKAGHISVIFHGTKRSTTISREPFGLECSQTIRIINEFCVPCSGTAVLKNLLKEHRSERPLSTAHQTQKSRFLRAFTLSILALMSMHLRRVHYPDWVYLRENRKHRSGDR